ncbi:MAG: hypothetical protein F9K13_08390 [Candidatus Methylomirabilis oxygeniifera]|uniref:Putative transcriptional regulator, CopG family n=1 Tax=Methylomirabilis oxygeniifera TaxID=671143 RepID=D5MIZ3_METO1|nr:MAG: hypothetical protein F9K13_08390 [Candidatus Methylomirabilis oxyfera]CBE67358.1 putative transcriptional regulator, CopG family [Candidatus Methylomirabilis oxyfera]
MRTTIELTDDQRARLLALAAKRRLRGYSVLIHEALERYLEETPNGGRARAAARAARKVRGTLSENEAERMRQRIAELWKRWR